MNMFAMGHGLHSAVRQEIRKFLYIAMHETLKRINKSHANFSRGPF